MIITEVYSYTYVYCRPQWPALYSSERKDYLATRMLLRHDLGECLITMRHFSPNLSLRGESEMHHFPLDPHHLKRNSRKDTLAFHSEYFLKRLQRHVYLHWQTSTGRKASYYSDSKASFCVSGRVSAKTIEKTLFSWKC